MLAAHHLLKEVIASLRTVIAPAVADPYPKSQAYMAAVILEFIARQVEERSDSSKAKEHVLDDLFSDLRLLITDKVPSSKDPDQEARLCRLIEWLYTEKDHLGRGGLRRCQSESENGIATVVGSGVEDSGDERIIRET